MPAFLIVALSPSERPAGLATLGAVPVIEFMAVSVGIGLGLNPLVSFFLTVFPCMGLCMLVTGIIVFLGGSSARMGRFLDGIQKRTDKYPRLKKYGVASDFLFVMFLGIYIAPALSTLLGWHKLRAMVFLASGLASITALIGLATIGIIDLFFI